MAANKVVKNRTPPNAGKGRTKGSPNKTTALLKDAILKAASMAGGSDDEQGLTSYLAARAIDTPGPFLALLGKVLPMQITGASGGEPISFTVIYEAKKGVDYKEAET
jgi:hypothetical protein